MSKKNIYNVYQNVAEFWSPQAVAEANGQLVKVCKIKGEFVWHHHDNEDEIFLVLKGKLTIQYRDREDVVLEAGDIHTVLRGVEHCPKCDDEVMMLLIEPGDTAHTGNVVTNMSKSIEAQRAHLNS